MCPCWCIGDDFRGIPRPSVCVSICILYYCYDIPNHLVTACVIVVVDDCAEAKNKFKKHKPSQHSCVPSAGHCVRSGFVGLLYTYTAVDAI